MFLFSSLTETLLDDMRRYSNEKHTRYHAHSAANELIRMHAVKAAPTLATMLDDDDVFLRELAVVTLYLLGLLPRGQTARAAVRDLLTNGTTHQRTTALELIEDWGDRKAVPAVIALVKQVEEDREAKPLVRRAALVLWQLGDERAAAMVASHLNLSGDDPRTSAELVAAIARGAERWLEGKRNLAVANRTERPLEQAQHAADVLRQRRDATILPDLFALFDNDKVNEHPSLCIGIVREWHDIPTACDAVLTLLYTGTERQQAVALDILHTWADARTVVPLIDYLNGLPRHTASQQWLVRRTVDVLGHLGDVRAAPAVAACAFLPFGNVRVRGFGEMQSGNVLSALGRLPCDLSLYTLLEALPTNPEVVVSALGELGDARAIPTLRDVALNHSASSTRQIAAFSLQRIGGVMAEATLHEYYRAEPRKIVTATFRALQLSMLDGIRTFLIECDHFLNVRRPGLRMWQLVVGVIVVMVVMIILLLTLFTERSLLGAIWRTLLALLVVVGGAYAIVCTGPGGGIYDAAILLVITTVIAFGISFVATGMSFGAALPWALAPAGFYFGWILMEIGIWLLRKLLSRRDAPTT
jgi:HEAT repeat protein